MSQGVMQMKSKFFVAVVLFAVFVLFAFFFFGVSIKLFSMGHPNLVAVHAVVGNEVKSAVAVLSDVVTS